MKNFMGQILMAGALLASAGMAGAASKHNVVAGPNDAVAKQVRHEIVMYSRYSIWDDVTFTVENGKVHLMGVVNEPYKKNEIGKLANSAEGVTFVQNDIRVLPTSFQDDRLRLQVARAVYGDPSMLRYAMQPLKPIHILVENSHVTLAGVVANEMDKQIAFARASAAGLSFGPVVNKLQVEHSDKKS